MSSKWRSQAQEQCIRKIKNKNRRETWKAMKKVLHEKRKKEVREGEIKQKKVLHRKMAKIYDTYDSKASDV